MNYTDKVRELAEAVRAGYPDTHHVAETLRYCASAIDDATPKARDPVVTSDVIRALTEEARAFRRERGFIGPVVEFAQLAHMIAPRESGTRFLPQARLDLQQFVLLAEPDRIELLCRMIELGARYWTGEAQEAAGVET